jgi:hypothetical protein
MLMQQPGRGNGIRRLKAAIEEYRARRVSTVDLPGIRLGHFMRRSGMRISDKPMVEIPESDPLMHVFFDR